MNQKFWPCNLSPGTCSQPFRAQFERLPVFAREDARMTWRPRGARGRWEIYLEVINLLNRKNAGALDPRLEYDSTSDRPKIVETPDQGIPRLPSVGVRFRF